MARVQSVSDRTEGDGLKNDQLGRLVLEEVHVRKLRGSVKQAGCIITFEDIQHKRKTEQIEERQRGKKN